MDVDTFSEDNGADNFPRYTRDKQMLKSLIEHQYETRHVLDQLGLDPYLSAYNQLMAREPPSQRCIQMAEKVSSADQSEKWAKPFCQVGGNGDSGGELEEGFEKEWLPAKRLSGIEAAFAKEFETTEEMIEYQQQHVANIKAMYGDKAKVSCKLSVILDESEEERDFVSETGDGEFEPEPPANQLSPEQFQKLKRRLCHGIATKLTVTADDFRMAALHRRDYRLLWAPKRNHNLPFSRVILGCVITAILILIIGMILEVTYPVVENVAVSSRRMLIKTIKRLMQPYLTPWPQATKHNKNIFPQYLVM